MSEKTTIQWCDSTWNPWVGCEKVSEGCKNCYAEALANRFGKDFSKRSVSKDATFNAPLKWRKKPWVCENDHATTGLGDAPLDGPLCDLCGGKIHRRRVFLGSMMDWLDPKISIDVFAKMLDIIRRCPELDFLCVTKRPELWRERLTNVVRNTFEIIESKALADPLSLPYTHWEVLRDWLWGWLAEGETPSNVWIIASAENQAMAEKRIPELLKIPAVVRGLSIEPMLGPIDLSLEHLDWVIVGGESGKNARPCEPQWIRSIVEQCKSASVPCFVKQLGSKPYWNPSPDAPAKYADRVAAFEIKHPKGGDPSEWPEDLRVQQFPKVRRTI